MGKDARLRKLRREACKTSLDPATADFARTYQQQHPESVLLGSGHEKMSEVLQEFAEPLLDAAASPEEVKEALLLAIVAWNQSLLNDVQQTQNSSMFSDPGTKELFELLVARKRQLYPDNKRVILDFQMIPQGDEFRFNVISSLG